MRSLADVVSAMPGLSRRGALRAAELPECGLGHGRPLDRAIRAGLIIQDPANPWVQRGHYALFADELARRLFCLRRELMASPSPARADEIMSEADEIRAAQAADYAMAQEGAGQ
jgi:hypothetical protein